VDDYKFCSVSVDSKQELHTKLCEPTCSTNPPRFKAVTALESKATATARMSDLRSAAYDVIALAALRYGQQEAAARQLLARGQKHDHMAPLVAGAAKHAEEHFNSTQLVGGCNRSGFWGGFGWFDLAGCVRFVFARLGRLLQLSAFVLVSTAHAST
jgi:hypothetical protein